MHKLHFWAKPIQNANFIWISTSPKREIAFWSFVRRAQKFWRNIEAFGVHLAGKKGQYGISQENPPTAYGYEIYLQ